MSFPARLGRFEVELALGQGPVGRVLLARDTRLKRQVAIKTLREDLPVEPDERSALAESLRRGACAAALLAHPGIVVLLDADEDDRVGPYWISELVQAPSLRERLTRGPLPRLDVAALARALSGALTAAHSAGVIHGNVKPENVWLAPSGSKLGDFGFPRDLPAKPSSASPYTAPENAASGEGSVRGDQFSLAATLYEALNGQPPKVGADARGLPGPKSRGFPGVDGRGNIQVDAIFDCALAVDPGRRFPSCEAFAVTLAETLEAAHAPVPTPPLSQASLLPRSTRRWHNAAAGAAVLVIFMLLALGGQHRATSEGVSLRAVSRAFAGSLAPIRPAADAPTPAVTPQRTAPTAARESSPAPPHALPPTAAPTSPSNDP